MLYFACNKNKEGDGEMNNIEANAKNISYLLHRCPVAEEAMALDTASDLNGMIMVKDGNRLVMLNTTCQSSKALDLTGEMLSKIDTPADDKLFQDNIAELSNMTCENFAMKQAIATASSREMQESEISEFVMATQD